MMIHPSYMELMAQVNKENEENGGPVVTSRYSIVLAASKRARQINNGDEPIGDSSSAKALSAAVDELYSGKVRIVSNNTNIDTTHARMVEDIEAVGVVHPDGEAAGEAVGGVVPESEVYPDA